MILGINASRARSGGAKAHLIGILSEGNPVRHGFEKVHVWSYRGLLEVLPDKPWLVKHNHPAELEGSIIRQLYWERFSLPEELTKASCSILLNVDAGTISRFKPSVTMSRDMLSYEPGETKRFGYSKARLRLIMLKYIQSRSLASAEGTIFLTRYAADVIIGSSDQLPRVAFIPHGVSDAFKSMSVKRPWPLNGMRPIECLYVSNVAPYKHQWHVVRAIAILRNKGFALKLTLTGGGVAGAASRAQALLDAELKRCDPDLSFTSQLGFVPQHDLPGILGSSDLFVFASSCENMPNTLVEAMAVGLPIACSDRGPMPEILQDGGCYFDPENAQSIASAIEKIITDDDLRKKIAARAKQLSAQYSWTRCAEETFSFLAETALAIKK